jgi:vacuolar-type H+-ATPase subunit I/STV1
MDSIQLALKTRSQRISANQEQVPEHLETFYPLLISHLAYLRAIKGIYNRMDVKEQNEQKFQEFCKQNVLNLNQQFNKEAAMLQLTQFKIRYLKAKLRKKKRLKSKHLTNQFYTNHYTFFQKTKKNYYCEEKELNFSFTLCNPGLGSSISLSTLR